jgi:hypothetical protein
LLNAKRITGDYKYESKNYRTKLAHFVMIVNYSANWPSNLKHCHTSTATRCILLPWPSTSIPVYEMRSDISHLQPLYWGLHLVIGTSVLEDFALCLLHISKLPCVV